VGDATAAPIALQVVTPGSMALRCTTARVAGTHRSPANYFAPDRADAHLSEIEKRFVEW